MAWVYVGDGLIVYQLPQEESYLRGDIPQEAYPRRRPTTGGGLPQEEAYFRRRPTSEEAYLRRRSTSGGGLPQEKAYPRRRPTSGGGLPQEEAYSRRRPTCRGDGDVLSISTPSFLSH